MDKNETENDIDRMIAEAGTEAMDYTLSLGEPSSSIEMEMPLAVKSCDSFKITTPPKPACRKRSRKQSHQDVKQDDCEFIEMKIRLQDSPDNRETREANNISLKRAFDILDSIAEDSENDKDIEKHIMDVLNSKNFNNWHHDLGSHVLNSYGKDEDIFQTASLDELIQMPKLGETDLATALGIPETQRTPTKTTTRQDTIEKKIKNIERGYEGRFGMLEEYDIHYRAEHYVTTVTADPAFYVLPDDIVQQHDEVKFSSVNNRSYFQQGNPQLPSKENMFIHIPHLGKTKKRKSYDKIDCYVHHTLHQHHDPTDTSTVLPEGTKLIKPPNKLVELVAQAIDGSPDKLLQVQQVYSVLQNKYPYFRYMDKSAITSWRSSIRHALYQKWFVKVPFTTDLINCKGSYWCLNKMYIPKEWNMPGMPVLPKHVVPPRSMPRNRYAAALENETNRLEDLAAVQTLTMQHANIHTNFPDVFNIGGQDYPLYTPASVTTTFQSTYGYSTIATSGFSAPTALNLSTTGCLEPSTTTSSTDQGTSTSLNIETPGVSCISLPRFSSTPAGETEPLDLTLRDSVLESSTGDSLLNSSLSPDKSPTPQVPIPSPVFSIPEPSDLSLRAKENKENKHPYSLLDTPVRKKPNGDHIRCSLKIKQNIPKENATNGSKLIDKLTVKHHNPNISTIGSMFSKPITKFTTSSRPKPVPLKDSKQGNSEGDDQDSGYSGSPFMWAEDYKGEIHPIMYPGAVYYVPYMSEGQSGHYGPVYYTPDHPYEEHW